MQTLAQKILTTIAQGRLMSSRLTWTSQSEEQVEGILAEAIAPIAKSLQDLMVRQKELHDTCQLLKEENARLQSGFTRLSSYVKEMK